MTIRLAILFGGLLTFLLAIFHSFFPILLKWKDDLKNISIINRKIFMTFHIGLIALFLFYAFLSFVYTEELSKCDGLAGIITGFWAFVWLWRTIWQVTYLKPSQKNEKPLLRHIVMVVWFLMLFVAYSTPIAFKFLQ